MSMLSLGQSPPGAAKSLRVKSRGFRVPGGHGLAYERAPHVSKGIFSEKRCGQPLPYGRGSLKMKVKKQTSVKGVRPIVLPPPGFESVPLVMVTMIGVRAGPEIPEPIIIDGRAAIDHHMVDGLDRNDLVGVRFVIGKVRAGGDIAVDIVIIISIIIGTAHH